MKKILKTPGTPEQWIKVVQLSMDQMGLLTQTKDNTVCAFYDNQPLMKFQISDSDGTFLSIDYLDERDLDDFKLTAANIFSNFENYADVVPIENQTTETIEPQAEATTAEPVLEEAPSAEPIPDLISEPVAEPNEVAPQPSDIQLEKPVKKNKGLVIALIVIGALLIVGAAAFFGYRYIKTQNEIDELYANALYYYEMGSYEDAITGAQNLINTYPSSKMIEEAQALIADAEKAIENKKLAEEQAEKDAAQKLLSIDSMTVSEPDEEGYFELAINYTNPSEKEISGITFGVAFTDADGNEVTVDENEDVLVLCDDEGPFLQGEGRFDGEATWGYIGSNVKGCKLKSVYIAYSDETEYVSEDETKAALFLKK